MAMTETEHRYMASVYVNRARAIAPNSPNRFMRDDYLKQARQHFTAANNIAFFARMKGK